jgi:hypothetical protein
VICTTVPELYGPVGGFALIVPPAAGEALNVNEYCDGAAAALCVICTVCEPMVTEPVRDAPEFAAMFSVTVPVPVPGDPDATVSHAGSPIALQLHVVPVVTPIVMVEAAAPGVVVDGNNAYVHENVAVTLRFAVMRIDCGFVAPVKSPLKPLNA